MLNLHGSVSLAVLSNYSYATISERFDGTIIMVVGYCRTNVAKTA